MPYRTRQLLNALGTGSRFPSSGLNTFTDGILPRIPKKKKNGGNFSVFFNGSFAARMVGYLSRCSINSELSPVLK
jgi:hypothetical protein